MEILAQSACQSGFISRDDFEKFCPRTKSDGSCGFAVMIALLEFFDVVRGIGRGEFRVVDRERLRSLLGE